jgi:hypothetical protein
MAVLLLPDYSGIRGMPAIAAGNFRILGRLAVAVSGPHGHRAMGMIPMVGGAGFEPATPGL